MWAPISLVSYIINRTKVLIFLTKINKEIKNKTQTIVVTQKVKILTHNPQRLEGYRAKQSCIIKYNYRL